MYTITRLTYDDGDFTFSPMIAPGQERERAAQLAGEGMQNVTLTTYRVQGKKKTPINIETVALTGHPNGSGMLLVWSSVKP